jgi:hypothetical protein
MVCITYAAHHIPAGGELLQVLLTAIVGLNPGVAAFVWRELTCHCRDGYETKKRLVYENVVVEIKKSLILGALPLIVKNTVIGAEQELAVL